MVPDNLGEKVLVRHRHTSCICWKAPPENWLKINSDELVLHQQMAACGGVLRDASGSFVRAFATKLGSCPIAVAELWGVYHALNII